MCLNNPPWTKLQVPDNYTSVLIKFTLTQMNINKYSSFHPFWAILVSFKPSFCFSHIRQVFSGEKCEGFLYQLLFLALAGQRKISGLIYAYKINYPRFIEWFLHKSTVMPPFLAHFSFAYDKSLLKGDL